VQQLHLIGYTQDLSGLIFSTGNGSESDGFIVTVDDALLRSIDELRNDGHGRATGAPNGRHRAAANGHDPSGEDQLQSATCRAPQPASRLTPRDVQARLRMGQNVTQIAGDAGVDEAWVERFAGPVMAERALVVARALEMACGRPRNASPATPLGRLVATALAERGLRVPEDVFATSWSTWHLAGSRWVVRFCYLYRQRERVAEWEVDLRAGSLRARNRVASDLSRPVAAR
jgi:hypothetical protein